MTKATDETRWATFDTILSLQEKRAAIASASNRAPTRIAQGARAYREGDLYRATRPETKD